MRWAIIFIYFLLGGCHAIPDETSISMADTNIVLAIDYIDQQQFLLADKFLMNAEKLAPHYALLWDAKAYYQEKLKHFEIAEEDYRHAIQLAAKNGAVRNNYGVFLCRAGRYQEAQYQFTLAARAEEYGYNRQVKQNAEICSKKSAG